MTLLANITARIFHYVSPRKLWQRRDKPFKAQPAALPSKPIKTPKASTFAPRQEPDMSPESRINIWEPLTPVNGDADITLVSATVPTSATLPDFNLEGSTLLGESSPAQPKVIESLERSAVLPIVFKDEVYSEDEDEKLLGEYDDEGASDNELDANAGTVIVDDGRYMAQNAKSLDMSEEKYHMQRERRELLHLGWSIDSVFIFQKLSMRGHEPLFPIDWIDDFESFPEDLFTANTDQAFIHQTLGTTHHAQLALTSLCDLGPMVRDARLVHAPVRKPAYQIIRAVERYTSWAMKDGQVRHIWSEIPLFVAANWPMDVLVDISEARTLNKLDNLYKKWDDALLAKVESASDWQSDDASIVVPAVPTLYGVCAMEACVGLVSYIPATKDQPSRFRNIAILSFSESAADVWNSLAIAIFVIHCRDRMMQLKDCIPEFPVPVVEDPDV